MKKGAIYMVFFYSIFANILFAQKTDTLKIKEIQEVFCDNHLPFVEFLYSDIKSVYHRSPYGLIVKFKDSITIALYSENNNYNLICWELAPRRDTLRFSIYDSMIISRVYGDKIEMLVLLYKFAIKNWLLELYCDDNSVVFEFSDFEVFHERNPENHRHRIRICESWTLKFKKHNR